MCRDSPSKDDPHGNELLAKKISVDVLKSYLHEKRLVDEVGGRLALVRCSTVYASQSTVKVYLRTVTVCKGLCRPGLLQHVWVPFHVSVEFDSAFTQVESMPL